jgi:hypothetical protein
MSDAKETLGALLMLGAIFGIAAAAIIVNGAADATPGLTYESGDRPRENNTSLCQGPGAARCPPHHLQWTIPAGGSVTTRFIVDGTERSRITGSMLLRDQCRTVVDWAITTPGRTIARDTVRKAWIDEQFLAPAPVEDDRVVTFTARRTDDETCRVTLLWYASGATEW